MKILIVARGYPSKKYPTYGVFEFDQAKALVKAGCEVIYASIDLRSFRRRRSWGIVKENIEGVRVYSVNIPLGRVPGIILESIAQWALNLLYKIIIKNEGKPDIIHAHFINSGYRAAKLKDKTGIPLVITEHSSKVNQKTIDKKTYKKGEFAYKRADSLIAVSPSLAESIDKKFHMKCLYIPNMVDLDTFKYKDKDENEKAKAFNIVSVGNLIPSKGMDLLIDSFYEAFGERNDINLTIFGQGPEGKTLKKQIEDYNLDSRVKLMGLCPRETIAKEFSKSHYFALASKTETFGLAYIEAMASGLPVIGTRCGGPEEFIDKSRGILVEVDDKDRLKKALIHMEKHIDTYNKEYIGEKTAEEFSSKSIGERLKGIYRRYSLSQTLVHF